MVMYPGSYNGILEAGRHYVVLQKDHSNIAEVADIIRSPARASAVIERAYREIACDDNLSFAALSRHFDRVIDEEGFLVRTAPGIAERGWRAGLAEKAASINGRARLRMAQQGLRLEQSLLAAAKWGLPDDGYRYVVRRANRLRQAAKRLILGIQ